MSMPKVIELRNITKKYHVGDEELIALDDVSLQINTGEFIAITGASGSGKSTLMNIIGLLDKPSMGHYLLHEKDILSHSETEIARIRNQTIGFVFQSFNLLPRISVLDNVGLPLYYRHYNEEKMNTQAMHMLEKVGLKQFAHFKPEHLSGGQQQRVAIARAMVGKPFILLADEPTGALDSHTGQMIMDLFIELNEMEKITIVIITHDREVANQCKRIIHIRDGRIMSD